MKELVTLQVLLFSSFLGASTLLDQLYSSIVENKTTSVGVGAGVAVVGYLTYKLYWINYKYASQLALEANDNIRIGNSYSKDIKTLEDYFSSLEDAVDILSNEKKLYDFHLINSGLCIYSLNSVIRDLKHSKSCLEEKSCNVLEGRDKDKTFNEINIESLLTEINALIERLDLLNQFYDNYSNYSLRLDYSKKLADKDYFEEIKILNSDNDSLYSKLIYCVKSRYANEYFPLMKYTSILRGDLNRLERNKKMLPLYQDYISFSNALELQLRDILQKVEMSDEYNQEKKSKIIYDNEQQRLRIEQDKADAEVRKAKAEECKANAAKNKVALKWAKTIIPQQQQQVYIVK